MGTPPVQEMIRIGITLHPSSSGSSGSHETSESSDMGSSDAGSRRSRRVRDLSVRQIGLNSIKVLVRLSSAQSWILTNLWGSITLVR
jgi:hypothetical protein